MAIALDTPNPAKQSGEILPVVQVWLSYLIGVDYNSNVSPLSKIGSYIYTLYLFTASDFTPVLIPQTLFALFSSSSRQFASSSDAVASPTTLLSRLPHTIIWIWLQLLVLDLSNQRQPGAIAEDALNKPWRPIPSHRITPEGTRRLLAVSIFGTLAASMYLCGTAETLILFASNWLYNDLELSSEHWIVRNLMNGIGITTIGLGALQVICGPGCDLDPDSLLKWWLLCAGMITTTIHAQDLYDQEGDAARGRKTAPLVLGDNTARWTIVVAVAGWSVAMPALMGIDIFEQWFGYLVPLSLGALIVIRMLAFRSVAEDKKTFKAWAAWTVCLYALPLVRG